jgi:hypothetical protein
MSPRAPWVDAAIAAALILLLIIAAEALGG